MLMPLTEHVQAAAEDIFSDADGHHPTPLWSFSDSGGAMWLYDEQLWLLL